MPPYLKDRLIAGGFWVFGGKVVTVGSTLAVHALLTHLLSAEDYGVYLLAFSVATAGAMLGQLGLHQAVVRLVAESRGAGDDARAGAAIRLVYRFTLLGVGVVAAALLAGAGPFLAMRVWNAPALAAATGALAGWVAVTGFQVLTSETFRGLGDLRLATVFGGVVTGIAIVLALFPLWLIDAHVDVSQVILISIAAAAASLLVGLLVLSRRMRDLEPAGRLAPGAVFAISLPLWVNGITAFVLMKADIWLLGAYRSAEELAVYGNAATVVGLVSMSLILVNLVVPPFIADLYAKGERVRLQRMLRSTATFAGVPALVVLLAFVFFGAPLLGFVFGDFYRSGAPILALLSLGKLVNVWTGSCGVTMSMTGHQGILMRITLVTSALTVAAAFLTVRGYGPLGVAAVVCAGTIVQNLSLWLATRRYAGLWTHAGFPSRDDLAALLGRRP